MKISFSDCGDHSVGIGSITAELDVNVGIKDLGVEEREELRVAFAKFMQDYFDTIGVQYVTFEDECADCNGRLKEDGHCWNKGCVSNYQTYLDFLKEEQQANSL